MRKDTTLSFFDQRRPDWIETTMPVIPAAPSRTHPHAPGWNRDEGSTTWDCFTKTVVASPPETAFFLDTSFLHRHEIPKEVFDALLSRKIVVTSLVWAELQDWIGTPFANRGFRDVLVDAKQHGSASISFLNQNHWTNELCESARYYVSLLLLRKTIGHSLKQDYASQRGHEIAEEALTGVLQSAVGDRGVALARKGLLDHEKPNFAADEELVVLASMHAIQTGYETYVLTRDRDPLEQFRKLLWLVDTHFRSHLIAEAFLDTPENFIEFNDETVTPRDCFEPGDRSILGLPHRFADWVLPRPGSPVLVHCHRLAGEGERMKFASLHFCAQREMLRLLEVKGVSRGKNYELPNGKNCHLVVSPPFSTEMNGLAIIGKDRTCTIKEFSAPFVDVEYALQEVQRIRQSVVDLSVGEGSTVTPGVKLADFFLPTRLCFAAEPGWESLDWEELTKAIRFFDATALFFVDRGVIPRLRVDARQALVERGFRWSSSIRDATLVEEFAEASAAERRALSVMPTFAPRPHPIYEHGFGYYLALMSLRKQFARIIRERVRKEFDRECRTGEAQEIAEHYGGTSGRRFAEHGEANHGDSLLFAGDESLVYGSILGILDGSDVVFVTKDPLFLDQFAKLCHLLGPDYVASEYGRRHANDTTAFPPFDASIDSSNSGMVALGKPTARRLPSGWREKLLPRKPYLINLHCWLVGRDDGNSVRFAAWTYCAERGMHNLLKIKGSTGGRNVQGLDGRNLRAAFSTENGEDAIVTVWNDRMILRGTAEFPFDDRLDLGVPALAAADISRVHINPETITLPWYEAN